MAGRKMKTANAFIAIFLPAVFLLWEVSYEEARGVILVCVRFRH